MSRCDHNDRPNVLSLPSAGNPHCCRDCWNARMAGITPYKGKREAWDHNGYDYQRVADGQVAYRTSSGWQTQNPQNEKEWK